MKTISHLSNEWLEILHDKQVRCDDYEKWSLDIRSNDQYVKLIDKFNNQSLEAWKSNKKDGTFRGPPTDQIWHLPNPSA